MPSEKMFISPRSRETCARDCAIPALVPSASIKPAESTARAAKRYQALINPSWLADETSDIGIRLAFQYSKQSTPHRQILWPKFPLIAHCFAKLREPVAKMQRVRRAQDPQYIRGMTRDVRHA